MLRNNWKPPDYRRAALAGKQGDQGGGGGGEASASASVDQENGSQVNNNGHLGPEGTRQLVDQMVRQDRRELAGDRQKMFKNQMQLIQRRKTASKGNIVTFVFNERNAFVDKQGAINNVLRVSGFTPSNVLSLKLNDFRNNECEVMFKDEVPVDCEVIEDKIRKNGMNVSVSKFIETEEICMVYGLPLTSDVEGMKEQIRETIRPFVKKVVSITATTHFGKNQNDFFSGRLTGDYKVKVVPLTEGQIPYYVSIGDQQVMGRVHYVRKMTDKKVMCDACFSTDHMMRDTGCPGVMDWQDYVKQFEEMRDEAIRSFDVASSGPAPAPSFVTRNAEVKRLTDKVVDLQTKVATLEAEKLEYTKSMDEMVRSSRKTLNVVNDSDGNDSFGSMEEDFKGDVTLEDGVSLENVPVDDDTKRKISDQSFERKLVPGDSIWIKTTNKHCPKATVVRHFGENQTEVMDPKTKKKSNVVLSKCKWGLNTN